MELLLLQDIAGVGKKDDIIVVGDGFALNCLLPERKALVATPTVRKRYAEQIKHRAEERETERKLQQQVATALSGKTVHFLRKITKTGKLYAAVSAREIAEALKEHHGVEVAADHIDIVDPIKSLGNVTVQVRIGETSYPLLVSVAEEKLAKK